MFILRSHRTGQELQASVPYILSAPSQGGTLALIAVGKDPCLWETPSQVRLSPEGGIEGCNGVLGDGSADGPDGPDPERQIRVISSRVMRAIAGAPRYWSQSERHLYLDMDLTPSNVKPGTVLDIGSARLVATAAPPIRAPDFAERFGRGAAAFVYGGLGHQYRFCGFCARVLQEGEVSVGDKVQLV